MDNKKADRLKKLMLELNLKQSDIARDCGVSSQYISAVLNNKRPMSDRLIERVAYRYKINQDWITYGVGDMFRSDVPDESIDGMDSALGTFFADLIGRSDADRMKRLVYYLSQIDREMIK